MFDCRWTFRRALSIVSLMASSPLVAVDETSDALQTGPGAATADILSLFLRLLPAGFFARLRREKKLRENNRIYNAAVVMWLMTQQRLQGECDAGVGWAGTDARSAGRFLATAMQTPAVGQHRFLQRGAAAITGERGGSIF